MTADDDRIAYLAGDGDVALPVDDRHDLDALRDVLADPALWAEPDPTLEDQVVAAIADEAAAGGEVSNAAGGVMPAPPAETGPSAPRAKAARRWSRGAAAWSGVAVAAAVALILGVVLALRSGSPSGDHLSLALAPTELVPGASGHASLTKTTSGWRIELDATGLPRLDGGRFYQAWLRNDAGVLVPVGTFNEGADVTLWAGVSPRDFRTLTITEEEADGNQASSGQRVLVGTVSPGE